MAQLFVTDNQNVIFGMETGNGSIKMTVNAQGEAFIYLNTPEGRVGFAVYEHGPNIFAYDEDGNLRVLIGIGDHGEFVYLYDRTGPTGWLP